MNHFRRISVTNSSNISELSTRNGAESPRTEKYLVFSTHQNQLESTQYLTDNYSTRRH